MSKEEERELSEEMATKKREKPQRALLADGNLRNQKSVIRLRRRILASFRGDDPSSFDVPCSTFSSSPGRLEAPFGCGPWAALWYQTLS